MLGARARAAEYNAYKAATARQAHRDAEEQLFPPKQVPVALSAFSRGNATNRKRGNKTWRPLILDDFPENDGYFTPSVEDSQVLSTTDNIIEHEGMVNSATDFERPAHNGMPDILSTKLSLSMAQAQSWVPATTSVQHLAFTTSTPYHPFHPYTSISGHNPPIPSFQSVSKPAYIQSLSMRKASIAGQSYLLHPCDISPSKQELKLASLAEEDRLQREENIKCDNDAQTNYYRDGLSEATEASSYSQGSDDLSMYGSEAPYPTIDLKKARLPALHKIHSEPTLASQYSACASSGTPPRPRQRSYADESPSTSRLARQVRRAAIGKGLDNELQIIREKVETYDRKSKMEKFMATQQALAKTGRTVLHNPELHKKLLEGGQDIETTSSSAKDEGMKVLERIGQINADSKTNSSCSVRPAPKVEFYKIDQRARDDLLRQEFGVGTIDWFQITPVTARQRHQMLRVIKGGV